MQIGVVGPDSHSGKHSSRTKPEREVYRSMYWNTTYLLFGLYFGTSWCTGAVYPRPPYQCFSASTHNSLLGHEINRNINHVANWRRY